MDDKHNSPHIPATILLVEDELELSVEIKQLFETIGYQVVVASNEKNSLALLAGSKFKVGLILINQRMLSDDVLAIGRRIREDEHVVASARPW